MSKHWHPRVAMLVLILLLVECFWIPSEVDAIKRIQSKPSRRVSNRHVQRRGTQHKGHARGLIQRGAHKRNNRVNHGGGNSRGMIVTYWGQFDDEGTLTDACKSNNYNVIILSFLSNFGHHKKPTLNLAGHCDPGSGDCKRLSNDIDFCQSRGVRILLSIGGADGEYGLDTRNDADFTAIHIWNSYLGGHSKDNDRPLGPAVLNGVDFDIEKGSSEFYATLATTLRFMMLKFGRRQHYILGAAPQCPFQDQFMGPGSGTALSSGVFDYVWVQFYNNEECHYNPNGRDPSRVLNSWKRWTNALPNTKIFLGLPASLDASTDSDDKNAGFMPIDVFLNSVVPVIKKSPNYGGVMLWSYYYDLKSNKGKNGSFSQTIKRSV